MQPTFVHLTSGLSKSLNDMKVEILYYSKEILVTHSKLQKTDVSHKVHLQSPENWQKATAKKVALNLWTSFLTFGLS